MHCIVLLYEFRLMRNDFPLPVCSQFQCLSDSPWHCWKFCAVSYSLDRLSKFSAAHLTFLYFVLIVLILFFFLLFCQSHTKRQLSSTPVMLSCISPPRSHSVWMSRSAKQVGKVAAVIEPNAEEANKHAHTSLRPPANQPLILFKLRYSLSAWTQLHTCTCTRKISHFCRRFLQTVYPAHPKQPPPLPFFNFPLCLLMFLLPTAAVFCFHPVAASSVA